MSWAGLANNQTVSFNNLQNAVTTGYFYALTTIPTSLEQITKSDASTYVSIDTAYAPYAAKTSNQLVVKSNLKPIFQYSGTFYFIQISELNYGWNSSANACANYSSALSTTVSWNGSLGVGTVIFTTCASSSDYYVIFYSGTAYWITFSYNYFDSTTGTCVYTITGIGTCVTSNSGSVKFSNNDATICSTPLIVITAYWDSSYAIVDAGVTLYYDSALTSPVTGYSFAVQDIAGYQIFDVTPSTGFVTGGTGIFC
jgi:hypothetical protein